MWFYLLLFFILNCTNGQPVNNGYNRDMIKNSTDSVQITDNFVTYGSMLNNYFIVQNNDKDDVDLITIFDTFRETDTNLVQIKNKDKWDIGLVYHDEISTEDLFIQRTRLVSTKKEFKYSIEGPTDKIRSIPIIQNSRFQIKQNNKSTFGADTYGILDGFICVNIYDRYGGESIIRIMTKKFEMDSNCFKHLK